MSSDDEIDWPEHAFLPPTPWGRPFELMDMGVIDLGLDLRFHHTERLYTMPSDEKLTPERAVRLLRAKGGELEAQVATWLNLPESDLESRVTFLAADIALIAQLLADHIERWTPGPPSEFSNVVPARANQGYLNSILEVTEFEVGSKEEAEYVAALKAECDSYLGSRQRLPWGPDHPDYDEMGQ
jgi:hypothetical protein